MRINECGYIERRTSGKNHQGRGKRIKAVYRDWFLGKKQLSFKNLFMQKKYWGKHIRFKIEVFK